jgi:predicted oxidoreductase (fatty acid repression mutant protein)
MNKTFNEAITGRRSIYALGKNEVVTRERIQEVVEFAVKHVPSPFNSQSGRVVILFGSESSKFWDITREALRPLVPADAFAKTDEKLKSFDAGYGTVLFFEDQSVVKGLMDSFPLYADNFPVWSLQSNGMLEFTVWTALEAEGLGASLQHYNPLVDEKVKKNWSLPDSWKLLAEMPFGSVVAPAGVKEFLPLETRVRTYG